MKQSPQHWISWVFTWRRFRPRDRDERAATALQRALDEAAKRGITFNEADRMVGLFGDPIAFYAWLDPAAVVLPVEATRAPGGEELGEIIGVLAWDLVTSGDRRSQELAFELTRSARGWIGRTDVDARYQPLEGAEYDAFDSVCRRAVTLGELNDRRGLEEGAAYLSRERSYLELLGARIEADAAAQGVRGEAVLGDHPNPLIFVPDPKASKEWRSTTVELCLFDLQRIRWREFWED